MANIRTVVTWGTVAACGWASMEIWWNPSARDANGRTGAYARVDGGARYGFGQWPSTDPKAFLRNAGEVYFSENPARSVNPSSC